MSGLTPALQENKALSPAIVRQKGDLSLRVIAFMKHACGLIASDGYTRPPQGTRQIFAHCRKAALLPAVTFCGALIGAVPASAQIEMRDLNNLPSQRTLPPYLTYIPTDPHLAVRDYLRATLPSMWWGREIDYAPGRVTLEIHPALNWKGNPTSMMIRFCPPSNHNLWRLYKQIEMRPYYQKKYWPSYTCRRV